jgi:PAS domain-containing protein
LNLISRNQIPRAAFLLAKNIMRKPTGPDEFILNVKNGKKISVEISTIPIKIKGRTFVLGIAHDISDRKKVQEAVEKEAAKLSAMISGMEEGIVFADTTDKVIEVNDYFLKIVNREKKDVLGKSLWEVHKEKTEQKLRNYIHTLKNSPIPNPSSSSTLWEKWRRYSVSSPYTGRAGTRDLY